MNILSIPCNTQNYGGLRAGKVETTPQKPTASISPEKTLEHLRTGL